MRERERERELKNIIPVEISVVKMPVKVTFSILILQSNNCYPHSVFAIYNLHLIYEKVNEIQIPFILHVLYSYYFHIAQQVRSAYKQKTK